MRKSIIKPLLIVCIFAASQLATAYNVKVESNFNALTDTISETPNYTNAADSTLQTKIYDMELGLVDSTKTKIAL